MYAQGEQIIVSATSGTNLYPVFEDKETHILAYSANGGKFTSTPKAAEMTYDNETNEYYLKTITVEPTREGYVFGGWSVKSANPAENEIIAKGERYAYKVPDTDVEYNHILYAVWTPIKYTITYNANKAPAVDASMINKADADASKPILKETLPEGIEKVTDSSYKQTFEYDKEGNFVAPQFDYPGYVFKGWAESATGNVVYKNLQDVINMTTVDGKNYTVYAVWEMDTPLTITYRANGGALKQITPAATVENPNPVPEDVEVIVAVVPENELVAVAEPVGVNT